MKKDIRITKNSDELNKEDKKIKAADLWVKIVGMHKIQKLYFLTSIKWLKSVLKRLLKTVFTT